MVFIHGNQPKNQSKQSTEIFIFTVSDQNFAAWRPPGYSHFLTLTSNAECARPLLRLGRGGHRAHPQEREEPGQVPAVRGGRHQAPDARALHLSVPGMSAKITQNITLQLQ